MEKDKSDIQYLEQVAMLLDDTNMSRLDFDELKQCLLTIRDTLSVQEELAIDHACLRKEFEQRITGMIKAIAAVDRKHSCWEEALALVEELPALRAEKLLETARRVAARFRDYFPGSYGLHTSSKRCSTQQRIASVGR